MYVEIIVSVSVKIERQKDYYKENHRYVYSQHRQRYANFVNIVDILLIVYICTFRNQMSIVINKYVCLIFQLVDAGQHR